MYIDIDIWDPIPPPFVLPHLWYPPPNRDRYYSEGEEYVIHLPAGILEPDGLDQAFIERIEYLRSIGRGDSFLVCLFQTEDPISDEDVRYLFEQGVTFYRFLSSHTAIIDISVEDISLLLMGMPNFRWIDEYRAEYKYRHDPPESSRRGAYIHSLVGDSIEFRNALKHIGISVIMYYEETEDYYVVADWDHFHEIAGLWWVEKVYKEPDTFSGVFAGE